MLKKLWIVLLMAFLLMGCSNTAEAKPEDDEEQIITEEDMNVDKRFVENYEERFNEHEEFIRDFITTPTMIENGESIYAVLNIHFIKRDLRDLQSIHIPNYYERENYKRLVELHYLSLEQ